jgi:hypothetical protein
MAHENLSREEHVEGSSDRSFGLVFACVFLIIAAWPLFQGAPPRWWAIAVSAIFSAFALVKPGALAPLNRLWTKLGVLLGRVVAPVALAILFYLVLTPIGVVMRLTGKDNLHLKRDPTAKSYWVLRQPPGPPPDSMTNQF